MVTREPHHGISLVCSGDPIINMRNAERGCTLLERSFVVVALLVGGFAVGAEDAEALRVLGCWGAGVLGR